MAPRLRLADSESPTSADTPMTEGNDLPPDRVPVDRPDESMAVSLVPLVPLSTLHLTPPSFRVLDERNTNAHAGLSRHT